MNARYFPTAPMDRLLRSVTYALLVLPVVVIPFVLVEAPLLALTMALATLLLYGSIYGYYRPHGYELDDRTLWIRFPLRSKRVELADITAVERLDRAAMGTRFRFAIRVGVGGLWGVFGLLWTRREGASEVYLTHVGNALRLERRGGRPLLITPADLSGLRGALARLLL